ncbi:MAG: hypothetical protein ABIR32_10000 [Ilumatobacteraceae bacterium]
MGDSDDAAAQLYTVAELLGRWSADDPLSYAATHDLRMFAAASVEGLRVPNTTAVARDRAMHDLQITRALGRATEGRRVVAFMGGHQLVRGSVTYAMVAEISWTLARHEQEFLIVSGGGPGAMEAAHLGARLAPFERSELDRAMALIALDDQARQFPHYKPAEFIDAAGHYDEALLAELHRWQAPAFAVAAEWGVNVAGPSIGIPTWLYGHEPPTPLATRHAKYYENSIREDGLLAIAKSGVIFAEGSAGTLQEVFQDAAQNFYSSVDSTQSPMVFLDIDEFWTVLRPVRLLLDGLFDDATERIMSFVDTAADAVAAIVAASRAGVGSGQT